MARLLLDRPIEPVAKYRCFVFQVFQGRLVPVYAAVGPIGYGREYKAVDETPTTMRLFVLAALAPYPAILAYL